MSDSIIFKVYLDHEFSRMPIKAHPSDSGYDLSSCEHVTIPPKQWRMVNTGLKFEIPSGYEIQVRARSGLAAKKGITVLNGIGTIDSNYRGLIKVILINHGEYPFDIAPGDKIAQSVMAPVLDTKLEEIDHEPSETDRGTNGFGSTG
jgi:dUTP pyrophosphatase